MREVEDSGNKKNCPSIFILCFMFELRNVNVNVYIYIIHLQENRWQYMKGLLFNVIYGGRIDNTVIAIFLNTVQSQVIN